MMITGLFLLVGIYIALSVELIFTSNTELCSAIVFIISVQIEQESSAVLVVIGVPSIISAASF